MKKLCALMLCFLLCSCSVNGTYEIKKDDIHEIFYGSHIIENEFAVIDCSNMDHGYVIVHLKDDNKNLALRKDGYIMQYVNNNNVITASLSCGNGDYELIIYDSSTRVVDISETLHVELKSETIPFLFSNQVVNFDDNLDLIDEIQKIIGNSDNEEARIKKVFEFVSSSEYDLTKKNNIKGYVLPDVRSVIENQKGICFDFAATMAMMLRMQNIPCKLITGYYNEEYHAWVEVWMRNKGENEKSWVIMDPTFKKAECNAVDYEIKKIY